MRRREFIAARSQRRGRSGGRAQQAERPQGSTNSARVGVLSGASLSTPSETARCSSVGGY